MKNKLQSMSSEFRIVPMWALSLSGVAFAVSPILFYFLMSDQDDPTNPAARVLLGTLAGFVLAVYVMLIGYISRDARRRAMKVWLWTLVAFFTPHGLGIILYFFLRQPLGVAPTPVDLPSDSSFCPRCGHILSPVAS